MDRVSFPFWRWILGIGPPGSGAARQMYELEVAQLAGRSREPALVQLADTARERELTREEAARAREVLLAEGPSQTLAAELQRAA